MGVMPLYYTKHCCTNYMFCEIYFAPAGKGAKWRE